MGRKVLRRAVLGRFDFFPIILWYDLQFAAKLHLL